MKAWLAKFKTTDIFSEITEWLLLILLFLAPTIFDRRLGIVFSQTKVAFIQAFIILILGVWLFRLAMTKQWPRIKSPANPPVLLYILCATVATIFSIQIVTSFMGFYGRYEGWVTLVCYVLLFFITLNTLSTKRQFQRVIVVVMLAAVLMSVYGIMQRHMWDPYEWGGVITEWRIIATVGQPNFAAAYVNMAFYLMLAMLMLPTDKKHPEDSLAIDKKRLKKSISPPVKKSSFDWWPELVAAGAYFLIPIAFVLSILNTDGTIPSQVPIWYFSWVIICTLVVLFVLFYEKIRAWLMDMLISLSMIITFICILYTQSRGGLVGFVAGGVLFFTIIGRKNIFQNISKLAPILLILFLIVAYILINPGTSPLHRFRLEVGAKSEVSSLPKVEASKSEAPKEKLALAIPQVQLKGAAGSRLETWKSAVGIISDHPLFGIGPEVMKMKFPQYETDAFRFLEAFHVKQDRCHNEVLDMSVTRGEVTLLVYVWLLGTIVFLGYRTLVKSQDRMLQIMLVGFLSAWASYLVQNQFSFGVVAIGSLFWVLMGLVAAAWRIDQAGEMVPAAPVFKPGTADGLWVLVIIMVMAVLMYLAFIPFRADIYLKSGKTYSEKNIDLAIENFKLAADTNPWEGSSWTNLGLSYFTKAQNLSGKERDDMLDLAIETVKRAISVDPYNADNFQILGKVYLLKNQLGDKKALDQSLEISLQAIAIDPYYAEVFYNIGLIYELKGNSPEAFKNYQRANLINPGYEDSMRRMLHLAERENKLSQLVPLFQTALDKYPANGTILKNFGLLYSRMGDYKNASQMFERLKAIAPQDPTVLFEQAQILLQQGDLAGAQSLLSEVVISQPDNVDAHNSLGFIYYRRGQRDRALNEFQQSINIDPANNSAKQMIELLK